MARLVLKDLLMKWKTRCEVISEAKNTKEKHNLLEEARNLWDSTSSNSYLAQDAHLTEEMNEPKDSWTPNTLRNWIQTQRLALDTATKMNLARQTLITTWLRPQATN